MRKQKITAGEWRVRREGGVDFGPEWWVDCVVCKAGRVRDGSGRKPTFEAESGSPVTRCDASRRSGQRKILRFDAK